MCRCHATMQAMPESYFTLNEKLLIGPRRVEKTVKCSAGRARVSQELTPRVLRHTRTALAVQKGIPLAAI